MALLLLACVLLAPAVAQAHQQGRSYCTVRTAAGGLDVSVETAAEHLVPVIALSSRTPSDTELRAAEPRLMQALEDRVTAWTPDGPCRFEPEHIELQSREGTRTVVAHVRFRCPPGPVTLRNTFRMDVEPSSEVVCAIDSRAWVFRLGLEERDVGTPPRIGEVISSFLGLGAVHVFGGPDHVLFVLALLIAAARAGATESGWRVLRHTALVATGFTLGHSLTLGLAALDIVRVDSRLTESAIALSVIVVAVENALVARPRYRLATATVFGLVHGFGFATVLADTELPRRGQLWALLGFNLGIELAQLALVLVLLPLLLLLARRTSYERYVTRPTSVLIALVGSAWLIDRVFALELGI